MRLKKGAGQMKNKKLFLLDMDGTIYLDDRLFDGVTGFLKYVRNIRTTHQRVWTNISKSLIKS